MVTTEQLEAIARGLAEYDQTHGNLPLFSVSRLANIEVGYRDTREVFAELARLRRERDQ